MLLHMEKLQKKLKQYLPNKQRFQPNLYPMTYEINENETRETTKPRQHEPLVLHYSMCIWQ